ncbi:MAG: hypothetical protein FJZ01_14815 [Candidatus Sericytochromatia bacterium]|nr:hypothetical protein [Candidatus Tanganyikabacteria bacterium]
MDATTSICIGILVASGSATPSAECAAWYESLASRQQGLKAVIDRYEESMVLDSIGAALEVSTTTAILDGKIRRGSRY